MSFVEELTWRGLLHQTSDPELAAHMRAAKFVVYSGFDPSSASLHVGNLLQITVLMRLARAGHHPIALVGGATGMIGDPSGKSSERNLLAVEEVQHNVASIRAQLERIAPGVEVVNNGDWFAGLGYLDFLRDVGKHFSVNAMLARDSVRARLDGPGISYTEFSYMLIQAYDFVWLYQNKGCRLQFGGSDQWGNIVSGVDLIRRLHGGEAFALTTPLITDSTGKKFGKTEKGAVWLDAARTSPDDFYQYFFNVADDDAGRLLRYFTFLDEKTIGEIEAEQRAAPEQRAAQRRLALELTQLVHGEATARHVAEAAAGKSQARSLDRDSLSALAPDAELARLAAVNGAGLPLVDLLVESGLCPSKSDARRQIEQGAVSLNNLHVDDVHRTVTAADLLTSQCVHLRKGKKHIRVLKLV